MLAIHQQSASYHPRTQCSYVGYMLGGRHVHDAAHSPQKTPHWYLYTLILGTTTDTHKFPAVSKEWRECRFHLTSSHKYKLLLLTGTPVVHDVNDRLHENLWTVCSIIIRGQAHTVTPRLFISNKSKLRLILRTGATNHLRSVLQYKNREVMTPSLLQTCQVYLLETANITEED
jgi:hypothetical protein